MLLHTGDFFPPKYFSCRFSVLTFDPHIPYLSRSDLALPHEEQEHDSVISPTSFNQVLVQFLKLFLPRRIADAFLMAGVVHLSSLCRNIKFPPQYFGLTDPQI